jgi:2'-deoxynucleoside 5'-phosphate N-hydrolase
MTAYIAVSFKKRKSVEQEITALKMMLSNLSINAFVFVDQYQFDSDHEKEMMQQAMHDLDRCDLLIAETSDKGIGIGIEVGYAKAKNKPVIYMRNKSAERSTTVSGISDYQILYEDTDDLQTQLQTALAQIKKNYTS